MAHSRNLAHASLKTAVYNSNFDIFDLCKNSSNPFRSGNVSPAKLLLSPHRIPPGGGGGGVPVSPLPPPPGPHGGLPGLPPSSLGQATPQSPHSSSAAASPMRSSEAGSPQIRVTDSDG